MIIIYLNSNEGHIDAVYEAVGEGVKVVDTGPECLDPVYIHWETSLWAVPPSTPSSRPAWRPSISSFQIYEPGTPSLGV